MMLSAPAEDPNHSLKPSHDTTTQKRTTPPSNPHKNNNCNFSLPSAMEERQPSPRLQPEEPTQKHVENRDRQRGRPKHRKHKTARTPSVSPNRISSESSNNGYECDVSSDSSVEIRQIHHCCCCCPCRQKNYRHRSYCCVSRQHKKSRRRQIRTTKRTEKQIEILPRRVGSESRSPSVISAREPGETSSTSSIEPNASVPKRPHSPESHKGSLERETKKQKTDNTRY